MGRILGCGASGGPWQPSALRVARSRDRGRIRETCGEPSGRPSEGGKALLGIRNRRGKDEPVYCIGCHPELGGAPGTLAMLERMGA